MNFLRILPALACMLAAARAGTPPTAAPPPVPPSVSALPEKKKEPTQWVFSLLPKSLQKDPLLELTVITEMTEAGKKMPPVSTEAPSYYELFSGGPRHLGDHAGNDVSLKAEEIERLLKRSLGGGGYLLATPPEHRASLLIIYTWGSHNLLIEGDPENPSNSAQAVARNMLDRAALVGGDKFAKELLELFQEADATATAARAPTPPGGEPVFTQEMIDFMNPVERFKRRSYKNEALVDQTASDIFYVVASAYDYKSVAANRRVLLWRTRMTVASAGVSPQQSLPTLVLAAAPYFGKDMPESEVLTKRTLPMGNVEVGTPKVIESDVKLPATPRKK